MIRGAVVIALVFAVAVAISCPACTKAQCADTTCGPKAPFECTVGMSKGGCAANASAWNNSKMCTACCDATKCDQPRFNCSATCTKEVCESKARCNVLTPFMCTSGTAANGCSRNSGYWPVQPQCDSCCDISSCIKPCNKCTPAECAANPCDPKRDAYECTSGPLKNGCSNSSSYFPGQSQCYSCCDATECPKSTLSLH